MKFQLTCDKLLSSPFNVPFIPLELKGEFHSRSGVTAM